MLARHGYVALTGGFQAPAIRTAGSDLQTEKEWMRQLILDMRVNPGGCLSAIDLAANSCRGTVWSRSRVALNTPNQLLQIDRRSRRVPLVF